MTSKTAGRPGRPADPDIEPRVIAATLDVYGAVGWAGFTIDAVARTSKVGKAAIYRRWASKQELIATAVASLRGADGFDVTGHLYEDLTRLARLLLRRYSGPYGPAYMRAMVEAKLYPEVLGAALDKVRQATIAGGRKIVLAAIDTGELPAGTSPSLVMDGLAGTIVHYVLMVPPERRRALHEDPNPFIGQVVSFVLSGTLRKRPAEAAASHSLSSSVALAIPPPSHIACSP
ncbi:TetR/AcrR family transcriptional regulator [Streptomyces boluensis]|uniref:TetR family transcriptional regulator n=1 Tax=Streptomyces boluensis TaxID=1775135 RepID=A0A964UN91_9ACTN|nr:TetR/AcrR family transcriptional regulator [Streptomyces boluensis]NBE50042.1 TetR family transcriptional regulator [Streptomyces boluensis]